MTLYICLPQRFVETHYRWRRMMTTLTVTEMEATRGMPASGHRVLMVMDEFPALRRMRVIENAAAQIAGYGVKLMFVMQTLSQLKDLYKDNWETLMANAGVKLFFCIEDNFSRDYVSKLVGDHEVVRTGHNASTGKSETVTKGITITRGWSDSTTSGHSMSFGTNGSSSFSRSATGGLSGSFGRSSSSADGRTSNAGYAESIPKRPLITPDEVGRLFGSLEHPTALALISGHQPLFLHRQYYYRDLFMAGYYDPHTDHPPPMLWAAAEACREADRLKGEARRKQAEDERRVEAAKAYEVQQWRAALADQLRLSNAELADESERARRRELTKANIWRGIRIALIVAVVGRLVYNFRDFLMSYGTFLFFLVKGIFYLVWMILRYFLG